MKSGVELIAIERQEQIEKHLRSIDYDVRFNSGFEKPLTKAASALTIERVSTVLSMAMKPLDWNETAWHSLVSKPYKERLIIAGALIAAEIDRLQSEEVPNAS